MHNYLSKEEILLIHASVIRSIGGAHGVRDAHILLSLEGRPQQCVYGKELYPTVYTKAALYTFSILTAHPFVDGNKRTGMVAGIIFLEKNRYHIDIPEGELYRFALSIIEKKLQVADIAEWFEMYATKL